MVYHALDVSLRNGHSSVLGTREFLVFVDNKKLLLVILHGLWWVYDTTIEMLRDGWEMDGGAGYGMYLEHQRRESGPLEAL